MSPASPFPYQGPLEPHEVAGREELARDLAERLVDHRLTALLGPRRYGKTSLLRRVCADLAAVGPDTVWIDLYAMGSMADLAAAVDRGLGAVTGPLRKVLDAVAGTVSLRLGAMGFELARGRRDRPEPTLVLRSLLDVLVRTAQRRPLVVVLDEFSGIAGVEGGAAALRTALQHHYRDMGIVFAGSSPSVMRTLFTDQAQPFFAQADLVELGPLDDAAVTEIVRGGFEATGREPGTVVGTLAALADGHPQRAMQLADALWRRTPDGASATDETWEDAVASVRADVDGGSERLFALLPAGQQKTLRVVATSGRVYGSAAELVDLRPGTARAAVESLTGIGYLARAEDRLTVVDPLFADWLRRRFGP